MALSESLAAFAAEAHMGRLRDDRLEQLIRTTSTDIPQMGTRELELSFPGILKNTDSHVCLHVVTTLYPVGGHVNFLERLIEWESDQIHIVLVTRQGSHPYNPETLSTITSKNGRVEFLEGNYKERAAILRAFGGIADTILLHTHPDDALPLIAFGNDADWSIGIINHADHAFWLGASIVDYCIDFRAESVEETRTARGIANVRYVPLPIRAPQATYSKRETRKELGIPEEAIVLVAMGSAHKFKPYRDRNYFLWIDTILKLVPTAWGIMIGLSEPNSYIEEMQHADRLLQIGQTVNPEKYLQASDYVVDPIPAGSFTAVLEGCANGCIPILPSPLMPAFTLNSDPAFQGLAVSENIPEKVAEAIHGQSNLGRETIREQLRDTMKRFHLQPSWIRWFREGIERDFPVTVPDYSIQADWQNEKFPKVANRLARQISDIGSEVSFVYAKLQTELWRSSGLKTLKRVKWMLKATLKNI